MAASVIARAASDAAVVARATLEHERALAGGGDELVQHAADLAATTEPDQAGGREHERVELTLGEQAQARVDVAVDTLTTRSSRSARS